MDDSDKKFYRMEGLLSDLIWGLSSKGAMSEEEMNRLVEEFWRSWQSYYMDLCKKRTEGGGKPNE